MYLINNRTMIFRNNWRVHNKQWDKFQIRIRVGKVDILTIEADISRQFYLITVCNFTMKNR
jgi:hypothetical protein